MPATLLLIKLEKQTIYNWKANKHAHITSVNKNVLIYNCYVCWLSNDYIDCFSSFINSRVTGINVAVSMRIGSKFSDLYLLFLFSHEPTTILINFIKM